jgi:hypothetical protein
MEFGICLLSIIPVRRESSHTAEMVTQILFGELYRVVEKENTWLRVQLVYDNYEGWIDQLQSRFIGEHEFLRLADSETAVTTELVQLMSHETRRTMIPIFMGSSLPGFEEQRLRVDQEVFYYDGLTSDLSSLENISGPAAVLKTRQQIIHDAILYLNAPYMWGGRSPFGIDCSGFVQMVYKLKKIKLLRDAAQQATQGEVISLLAEAEPGDIAFFDDEEGKIIHVGLIMDRSRIIHCSGKVRIDSIDHEGIYDQEKQTYTHKLRLIKRIV